MELQLKRLWTIFVSLIFLISIPSRIAADDYTWNVAANGDWTTDANWWNNTTASVNGHPDDAGDTATIDNGSNWVVNLDANITVGAITLGSNNELDSAGFFLTVDGNVTIDGNFNTVIRITMTGAGSSISASSNLGDLFINPGGGNTVSMGSSLYLDDDLSVQSGTFSAGANTFSLEGDWGVAGGAAFNAGTGSVEFRGGSAQSWTPGGTDGNHDFYNVVVNKWANSVALSGAAVITNNLTIAGGDTLNLNGSNITTGRDITGAGTLQATGTETITVGDEFNITNFTASSSTVILNNSYTPAEVSAHTFNNLRINKSAEGNIVQSLGAWLVNGNFELLRGTWEADPTPSGYTHRIVTDAWDSSDTDFTFVAGESTIRLSANNTITTEAGDSFYNLLLDNGATLTGTLDVDANLTISAGTLTASGNWIYVGGNWSNSGTFAPGGNTVVFNGNGAIQNAEDFNNVRVSSGSRTYAVGATLDMSSLLMNGGDLAINAGTLRVANDFTINNASNYSGTGAVSMTNADADLIISSGTHTFGGTVTLNGNDGDISISGGSTTFSATTTTNGATGGVTISGGTLTNNALLDIGENLAMTAGTLTGTGNISVVGNVTLSNIAATFNGNARTITVSGSWNESAGVFVGGTSTVIMDTGGTTIDATNSFENFTISAGGAGVTLNTAITVDGNIDISGNLDANGQAMNIAGNWDRTGTFTHNSNTVTFFDNSLTSTITGATTFWNFTCNTWSKTILFEEGVTQTVENTLTIDGDANNLIYLLSTTDGNPWTIDVSGGAQAVDFAFVRDSGTVLSNDITATNSRNDGNNDTTSPGWIFQPNTLAWDGSSSSDWDTPENWDLGFVPNTGDTVDIPNGAANMPATLASDTTVDTLTIDTLASVSVAGNVLSVTTYDNQGTLERTAAVGESAPIDTDSGLVLYDDAVGGTIEDYGSPGLDYYDIEFTGLGTFTLGSDLEANNNLTISAGTTFDVSGASHQVTVGGRWNNAGGTFTAQSGLVLLNGTGTISAETFNDLEIDSAGMYTMNGAIVTGGNLTITAGDLSLNANTLTVGADLTGNSLTAAGAEAISVGGDWDIGSFTEATTQVTFTGASGAGPFTVTSNGQSFNDVVLNAGGKIYSQTDGAIMGLD